MTNQPAPGPSTTFPTDADLWRFGEGTHDDIASFLGAHVSGEGADAVTTFAVWAPNAVQVSVIGNFNGWDGTRNMLTPSESGIWSGAVTGVGPGEVYKYRIFHRGGLSVDKADPVGFATEEPPRTASVVTDLGYKWRDAEWMAGRSGHQGHDKPMSIYEVHLGSWRYEPRGYRGLAMQLADHLDRTNFTHVELLPVMEHPFYGSWGYQTTGYFAPTARYGSPTDFMFLIDLLHQRGYGVILDWVPSHFPNDVHGLAEFDGTHLYEHADPRLGFHPDWRSAIFNYERHEVRSFLLSSARFWLSRYHIDGLRVDAVASMLYRDYSRAEGEWLPNEFGGNENLGAITFLQELNRRVYTNHPDTVTIAEESTAWPGVSRSTDGGGLGFGFKWDMGWMNDTLGYIGRDPVHRKFHHNELTFRMHYAFSENYVLPLSHDEVVHGKGSLVKRQPGDRWQKMAGLRLLFGYQYGLPGKKLLFMGAEFGVDSEWSHEHELPWHLLQYAEHEGMLDWVSTLNRLHRDEPALHELDCEPAGFEWLVGDDSENSVLAFTRWPSAEEPTATDRPIVAIYNFTPVPRTDYLLGLPLAGAWTELANSDATGFGGSGVTNGTLKTETTGAHGQEQSIRLTVPPLGAVFLAPLLDD
ncbi:MAG: 1,4-alpha-glucan branching protein GlgB [Acidimicrobiia bacterium]|nr:1,4-alpha-glucan branching protein GlgB [Acidimicrobiia bacterium]